MGVFMKLFLAPMQGMTTANYRNLFDDNFGGIDSYYAPFISTSELRKKKLSVFQDILPEKNKYNKNVVPQILSNHGADFAYYASVMADFGYKEINWNIGCPYPMVTKKKRGSGILPYPDLIRRILDEVLSDDDYKLTVKMRMGLNDPKEGLDVINTLNDYPLAGVMIHGRTAQQMYTGKSDLDAFQILKDQCKHEVTYNGDIFTLEDFKKIKERFPDIKKFMLGRGALYDPFLPSMIKGKVYSNQEKITRIKALHDGVYKHYKEYCNLEKQVTNKMKEFWNYTLVNLDSSPYMSEKIKAAHTEKNYLEVMKELFSGRFHWQI